MVHDDHPYLAGDINGDGRIDAADIVALRRYLSNEIDLYCKAAADVDGDGRITQADVDYLQRYVASHGPAPIQAQGPAGGAARLGCGYYSALSRR
jgi:hypothetical protein